MRRRGFSLVELLVVIGLITMLVGMLLPAVSRSRALATSVQCRSNLHQIGVALAAYAADNGGVVAPEVYLGAPSGIHLWVEPLFPEPSAREVVHCPTVAEPEREKTSYLMSYYFQHWSGTPRQSPTRSPSQIILMGERRDDYPAEWGGYIMPGFGPNWHPTKHGPALGSNYLYLDYHVDSIAPSATGTIDDSAWRPWVE